MKLNISIDDVSPHPSSSTKVLDRCHDLIKEFSDIKFSLFIPLSYWRTIKPGTTTTHPLLIDQHPDFCSLIKNLPQNNFEICYHGLFHGIPGKSDNDEFQYLSYDEAVKKFEEIFLIVEKSGLKNTFKSIFRPPAWRMSAEAIKAAKDVGIQILALSPKEYAKKTYCGEDENFGKVVYYNCNPPFDMLQSFDPYTEVVYHACEWDQNFLNIEKTEELKNFIKLHDKVDFCFMNELL